MVKRGEVLRPGWPSSTYPFWSTPDSLQQHGMAYLDRRRTLAPFGAGLITEQGFSLHKQLTELARSPVLYILEELAFPVQSPLSTALLSGLPSRYTWECYQGYVLY